MQFLTVKTRPLVPPKDNLFKLLDESLPKLKEGDILLITSKVLSIHQGRCLPIDSAPPKMKLIKDEAEHYLRGPKFTDKHTWLTIKDHTLIFSAGIDESNSNGHYVLWPKNTGKLLKQIGTYLKKKHKLKNLGLIATDTHSIPMRMGLTGISIGCHGFDPIKNYIGKKDIFGRTLQYTTQNISDSLAGTAVMLMGEGDETIPLVIARGLTNVKFNSQDTFGKIVIDPKRDLYYPILRKLYARKKRG